MTKLTYTDHHGAVREVRDCNLTVDRLDRHWTWNERAQRNLALGCKGRENALLAALDSALFHIKLRDERIANLQRIADMAHAFADQIKPDEDDDPH